MSGTLGGFGLISMTLVTTLVFSSCQSLKLSSPYERHFSVVRTAARDLAEAVSRQPFDPAFAQNKPAQLQSALAQVEASLASDPALDANYLARCRQLYQLYWDLTAYGFRVLQSKASGEERQIDYWLPIFQQGSKNTEAGYYDDWKSVKLLSLRELDRQAAKLESLPRRSRSVGRDDGAVASEAIPAGQTSACQAGPVATVTGRLKEASYGNRGGSFTIQPEAGPVMEFYVGEAMDGELPLFDHHVSEWDAPLPSSNQVGTNFDVRYRPVKCAAKIPTYDKQISSIEKR